MSDVPSVSAERPDPRAVADLQASTPEDLLRRGCARISLGREREAREDLSACTATLGDRARIELAFLDIRERGALQVARDTAARIAHEAPRRSPLEARARHVLGLAEGKLRRTSLAVDSLVRALDLYRELDDRARLAEVHDTLGSVFAAEGRLELALSHYALSIVEKQRTGDRFGTALTLGNMGRVHLRAGRWRDALDCFRLDLALAVELGDERGRVRMLEDIGRAWMGLERWDEAECSLRECIDAAQRSMLRDLELFARKDLALLLARTGRAGDGARELDAAERLVTAGEPYLASVILGARGEILLAQGDERALDLLERAAADFSRAELPDLEIPTLLALAEALCARGRKHAAEACLRRVTRRARSDGYSRYLPAAREAMTRLKLVEGCVEERGRLGEPHAAASESSDGYVVLGELGQGGFGEVHRAFDPRTGQVVALKRLRLDKLYDPERRAQLLSSARAEIGAASRLRHPGIARVFAIGTDSTGATYVVQELVEGGSLRRSMKGLASDPLVVLDVCGRIARALQELHAAEIVHRDLKPENVLLRAPDDSPVLIDFGLAHVPGGELPAELAAGTLAYMAPEQAQGRAVSSAADMWSLGAIAYEWLTGHRVFVPRSLGGAAILEEFTRFEPRPLEELRPDLGPEWTEMVDVLLERHPRDRPSAEEIAQHCEKIVRQRRGRA